MCTVTYLPTNDHDFIFTSNRDEAPRRSAPGIVEKTQNGKKLLFPQDRLAKGTWIAISNSNQFICILNGAFIKHKHLPPYRKSRGIMALEFFDYTTPLHFFNQYKLEGMESFTMIIFDNGSLYDFRWDESKKHIKKLDARKSHIWSSCTLYTPEWQQKRINWFGEWKKDKQTFHQKDILEFHKKGGEGHPNFDLLMKWKDIVQTVSITSIVKEKQQITMRYEDLLKTNIEAKNLLSII